MSQINEKNAHATIYEEWDWGLRSRSGRDSESELIPRIYPESRSAIPKSEIFLENPEKSRFAVFTNAHLSKKSGTIKEISNCDKIWIHLLVIYAVMGS